MENHDDNIADRMVEDLTDYVNLRTDALKLNIVENLSIIFSNAFGIVVFIILAGMGLFFFTAVLTYLLGLLIGSMTWAMVIMGGVFMISAVIVYANRQRIFADQMVRLFSRMMFDPKNLRDE